MLPFGKQLNFMHLRQSARKLLWHGKQFAQTSVATVMIYGPADVNKTAFATLYMNREAHAMKFFSAAICAICLSFVSAPASANLIVNAGFEDPVTTDGPPYVGSWEAYSLSSTSVGNSTGSFRSGSQSLQLDIGNDVDAFAGVFQDIGGMVAGDTAMFSGWHLARGTAGVEFIIMWRAGGNEISRTASMYSLTTGSDYEMFSLTSVVPVGADTARLLYGLQSFGGIVNQKVFLDDVSFVVGANEVPEPAALSLFGLAVLVLIGVRRRIVLS